MPELNTTEATGKVVGLLKPFESEDRSRIIRAALILLGESAPLDKEVGSEESELSDLPSRARSWIKRNSLSLEEIERVFHIEDGTAEIIVASVPGRSAKEKTYNTYVLTGAAHLLTSGEAKFSDAKGRDFCNCVGCFDSTNHVKYLKGTAFTGTKEKGWVLTTPGLEKAAILIKELSSRPQ